MKSLDLIIKQSLREQISPSINANMRKNDMYIKAQEMQRVARAAAKNSKIIAGAEKTRNQWLQSSYNFASNKLLALTKEKFAAELKSKTITRWKNTVADNYFLNIIKQDPNYNNTTSIARYSGIMKDVQNPGLEDYNYQILATDLYGKSIAGMLFHPDGTVEILPDLSSLANKAFTYKVVGNGVYIYDIKDPSTWALYGYANDYSITFKFNSKLQFNNYDPYKGAGLLRSLFLDLAGMKRKTQAMFKSQKDYEQSSERGADQIQTVLDWLGLIPGYGDLIDIVNAIWYFKRGKKFEAALSCIAIIPVAGSLIKLGLKTSFKAFKVGGKTGVEAIEILLKGGKEAKQIFLEYLAKNKEAREAVAKFIKNLPTAARSVVSKLKEAGKKLLYIAGFKWVGKTLIKLSDDYGKELIKYADDTAQTLGSLTSRVDDITNLTVAAGKTEAKAAGAVGEYTTKKALRNLGIELSENAGKLSGFMYKVVNKKFYDALTKGMIEGFIAYIKKGGQPRKFLTTIATTQGGVKLVVDSISKIVPRRVIINYLLSNPATFRRWLPNTASTYVGKTIDKLNDREISTIFDLLVRELSNVNPNQFGKMLTQTILVPLSKNVDELNNLLDDVIINCVQQGNIIWKIWKMNFWNLFKAAAPWKIYRYAESTGIGFLKYDYSKGNLFNISGPVGELFDKTKIAALPIIGDTIKVLTTILLKIVEGITNLKRLDIYYNEIKDLIEKTGQQYPQRKDGEKIDEKQGVVVSTIAYFFGTAPFSFIEKSLEFSKEVVNPAQYGITLQPSDYDFIENKKFITPVQK